MNKGKLASIAGFTATAFLAAGCATKPPAVTEQTKFEDLKVLLMTQYKWGTELATKRELIVLSAQIAEEAGRVYATSEGNFDKWCNAQGGMIYNTRRYDEQYYHKSDWPNTVVAALDTSVALIQRGDASGSTTSFTQKACDVQGSAYIQVRQGGNVYRNGIADRTWSGYRFAWFSPQELAAKGPIVLAEIAKEREAAQIEADKMKRYYDLKAGHEKRERDDQVARAIAALKTAPKGTQYVCTGRQDPEATISEVWFRCTGKGSDLTNTTIAGMAEYGWRVGSHTLKPVLMTSGRYSHDVTVIFEKAR